MPPRASSPARSCRWRARSGRPRRSSWSGAVVGGFNVEYDSILGTLQGRYTALPTTVYDWARKPPTFSGNVYAAIVVLILVLLLVNALAIYLRNRFERRW